MSECKCSMAISVNGDGCRYCQPQEYIDKLAEWLEESRTDYAALEAELAKSESRLHEVAVVCATAEQERDAALAECERLRGALQKIKEIENRYNCGDWDEIEDARNIADAALSARL